MSLFSCEDLSWIRKEIPYQNIWNQQKKYKAQYKYQKTCVNFYIA